MTTKHVFVSYSHENADVAKALIHDLAQVNVEVWIDKTDLQPGTPNWRAAIEQAIQTSQAVIFIASPASKNSEVVNDELGRAIDHKVPVIPFWVDGIEWFDTAPLGLGQMQYIDARHDGYHIAVTQLVMQLKSLGTGSRQTAVVSKNTANETASRIRVNILTVVLHAILFGILGFVIGVLLRGWIISTVVPSFTKWSAIIDYVKGTFGGLFGNDPATIENTVTVAFLTILGLIIGVIEGQSRESKRVKELKEKLTPKAKVPNTTLEDYYKLFLNLQAASQNNDRERMRQLLSSAPEGVKWMLRLNGVDPDNL
jgi:hypothetical protein